MAKRPDRGPSQRQLRVAEELRHALAEVLARGDLRDPQLSGPPVTVTEVRISPDLRNAQAFVVPLGGGDVGRVLDGLRRAAPYLRGQVARLVRLKFSAQFTFHADTSFESARRIDDLLNQPVVAADIQAKHGDDGDAA